jgi:DNA polymerase-3 subunit alpha
MSPRFVHLHLHSEYSLTDSTIRIPELVKRCVQSGLPAVALTDQSNLFALVKFYKEAEKAGIKPIAGADIWLEEDGLKPSRLTLLCQDRSGYLNLSALLSRAYLEGHRGDFVAIRPEWLQQANAGLIVLAGRDSDVGQISLEGKLDRAAARLERWQRHFGDRFYLEVTRTQRGGEDEFFSATLALAAQRDCAVVASNDVRFLEAEDFEAHEARVCISTGRVLTDPRRPRDFSTAQYLKSTEEMAALFADHPAVLENAVEIAKRCNLELSLGKYYLPAFPVPAEHTIDSWLRNSALAGLEARLAKHPVAAGHTRESYLARLDLELDVILKMGFPGYFLIVADFINWAKQHDIPVGPGRGSGAGSLVAWALGITDLDPMPYDLLFERFLNPERVSMPDFDIDFCMDKPRRGDRVRRGEIRPRPRQPDHHLRHHGSQGGRARHRPRARPSLRLRRRHRQADPDDPGNHARRRTRPLRSGAEEHRPGLGRTDPALPVRRRGARPDRPRAQARRPDPQRRKARRRRGDRALAPERVLAAVRGTGGEGRDRQEHRSPSSTRTTWKRSAW